MPKNSRKKPVGSNAVFSIILVVIGLAVAGLINHFGWDPVSDFLGLGGNASRYGTKITEGTVQVHFIDVGQGDSTLIITPEKSVLIDGGDVQYADEVAAYIKRQGVLKLDLIIISHPHADHMGGMDKIIAATRPAKLLMPEIPDEHIQTSGVFERMLDAIEEHSVEIAYAKVGETIELGEKTLSKLEILAPDPEAVLDGLNNFSLLVRLLHGSNAFLFTGDMEGIAEDDVLDRGIDISADVLKVSHHGSSTSSHRGFLNAVDGSYAVISVGSPNRYNHPNDGTVRRLSEMNYTVLRTDELGNIIFESNKDGISLIP